MPGKSHAAVKARRGTRLKADMRRYRANPECRLIPLRKIEDDIQRAGKGLVVSGQVVRAIAALVETQLHHIVADARKGAIFFGTTRKGRVPTPLPEHVLLSAHQRMPEQFPQRVVSDLDLAIFTRTDTLSMILKVWQRLPADFPVDLGRSVVPPTYKGPGAPADRASSPPPSPPPVDSESGEDSQSGEGDESEYEDPPVEWI